MKPKIGISKKNLSHVSTLLETALSNEMILYVKTRKFHWNVKGESFMELHKLFEGQYEKLEHIIDEMAERINKLGNDVIGTMEEFSKAGSLKEHPGKYPSAYDMITELLNDHETIIVLLRKDIEACAEKFKDAGTADFLTGLIEMHETISWTLRRYMN